MSSPARRRTARPISIWSRHGPTAPSACRRSANPPIVRRQDAPRCFDMNASIYAWRVAAFLENPAVFYPDTRLFEMPAERSVDIDSDLDFTLVELLLRQRLESTETKP